MRCEVESGCENRSWTIFLTDEENELIHGGYDSETTFTIFRQRLGLVLCEEHSHIANDEEELKRQITVHQQAKQEGPIIIRDDDPFDMREAERRLAAPTLQHEAEIAMKQWKKEQGR